MPQQLAQVDITDFPVLGGRVKFTRAACVYETTGNFRYIVPFTEMQAVGSAYNPSSGQGRHRVQVVYTDNTTFDVEISDEPFDDIAGNISTTATWYNVHGNGRFKPSSAGPSATGNYVNSASDNLNEELAVAVNKVLARARYYYTDN